MKYLTGVVVIGLVLLGMACASGPKLTEAEAIQVVRAYHRVQTSPHRMLDGRCDRWYHTETSFRAKWEPEKRAWSVVYLLGQSEVTPLMWERFGWTVYEKTLVVESRDQYGC